MKSILILAAVLGLAALPAKAAGVGTGDFSFKIPEDNNRNLAPNIDFVGARVSTGPLVAGATIDTQKVIANASMDTNKVWVTGAGLLYGVEAGKGASTSDYVVCFDTGAVLTNPTTETTTSLLMNKCFASASASAMCPGAYPNSGPPRKFERGLYCFTSTTGNTNQPYIPLFRKAAE